MFPQIVQGAMGAWEWIRDRLKDMARLPLMFLAVFVSSMAAWLLACLAWRTTEWVFHHFLSKSWIE